MQRVTLCDEMLLAGRRHGNALTSQCSRVFFQLWRPSNGLQEAVDSMQLPRELEALRMLT